MPNEYQFTQDKLKFYDIYSSISKLSHSHYFLLLPKAKSVSSKVTIDDNALREVKLYTRSTYIFKNPLQYKSFILAFPKLKNCILNVALNLDFPLGAQQVLSLRIRRLKITHPQE